MGEAVVGRVVAGCGVTVLLVTEVPVVSWFKTVSVVLLTPDGHESTNVGKSIFLFTRGLGVPAVNATGDRVVATVSGIFAEVTKAS